MEFENRFAINIYIVNFEVISLADHLTGEKILSNF